MLDWLITSLSAGTVTTACSLAEILTPPAATAAARQHLCQQLQELPAEVRNKAYVTQLLQTLPRGVGFYHSQLPRAVKGLIEAGMRDGR